MAEPVEGARLLSEYTGKTCIAGSNPALSAIHAPVAQLDRVFDYESKGREFESRRAHHFKVMRTHMITVILSPLSNLSNCLKCARSSVG